MQNGAALTAHLRESAAPRAAGALSGEQLDTAGEALLRIVDPGNGGIGRAPKFPNAPIFRFFWSEFFRRGDPSYRDAVRGLLDALSAGGIYDHLGGGFARYSVDAEWHVPHFEKMLYDNAQILELLALAHAEAPSPVYAARARDTFDWLQREMKVGDAYAASLDADQDGEEGLFYVWSAARSTPRSEEKLPPSGPPTTCGLRAIGKAATCCGWPNRSTLRSSAGWPTRGRGCSRCASNVPGRASTTRY